MLKMTDAILPDETGCFSLLEKYDCPPHIVLHSRMVWAVARVLAAGLLKHALAMDMALLQASCLLHDIAKYPCIKDGKGWHDRRGKEILNEEGLPVVGDIVGQHVILRDPLSEPLKEEHVLFYADKRVVHDTVVSLEDRFQYLCETYGKSPRAIEGLKVMRETTFRLEENIFRHLDFTPEQLAALIEDL
jgi:uncharacterized protein